LRHLVPASLVVTVLVALNAFASDRYIEADRLFLTDPPGRSEVRTVRFRAVGVPTIDPATNADPRIVGATIEVTGRAPGDGSSGALPLPAELWKGIGRPPGSRGYRWLDPQSTDGIREVAFEAGHRGGALLMRGGKGTWPYAVTQPQGPIDVRFAIGADRYCATFTSFTTNRPGRVVGRAAPAPSSCLPGVCGDGFAQPDEECDDGNRSDGDGCSASCKLENTSALCAGVPVVAGTSLHAVQVATGLDRPLHLTAPRLDPKRVFVVEQYGRVRIIEDGVLLATPFLSIENKVKCCGEAGLLSIAFHPDYATNGRFFIIYTNVAGETVLARYQVSSDPDVADEASELVLLTIVQPSMSHQGGLNVFGPDGYLYFGPGDGIPPDNEAEAAQDSTTIRGKLLRLDVDVETPPYYAAPIDNPYPTAPDPENLIWAKGLRNPWRFSFDRLTGDLYLGDVGQHTWEEIDFQPAGTGGLNYGWDIFEGSHCFQPMPLFADCPNPPTAYTMPVLEYDHDQGCAVVGGFVYRGCALPSLHGIYFYSDFCTSFVRTFSGVSGGEAQNLADRTAETRPSIGAIDYVSSFGEDARGELYIVDVGFFSNTGEVYKLVPGS
jgi:cysteine-rich repeat protein